MVEDHGYDKRLASALQLTTLLLFLCFSVFLQGGLVFGGQCPGSRVAWTWYGLVY